MYISDIAHRFDLLFKDLRIDLSLPSPQRTTAAAQNPDDNWALLVVNQLEEIKKFLQQDLKTLEQKHALSLLQNSSSSIDNIVVSAHKYLLGKASKKRLSKKVIQDLQRKIGECANANIELREKLKARNREIEQKPNDGSFVNLAFTSIIGTAAGIAQEIAIDNTILTKKINQLRTDLYLKTGEDLDTRSTAPAEMARYLGKFITHLLKEELINTSERDPLLRASFLKQLFYDTNVQNPTPSPVGSMLISLLQKNPELVERVIEANILQGLDNIYRHLALVQKHKPELLGDFLVHCLATTTAQISETKRVEERRLPYEIGTKERAGLVSQQTPKSLSKLILLLGFPRGAADIQLPLPNLVTPHAQDALYQLMDDGLTNCFYTAFQEMATNNNLKEALLLQGFTAIKKSLATADEAPHHPLTPTNLLFHPERPAFATAGIVFVFFQVLFSAIGETLKAAWKTILFQAPDTQKTLSPQEQALNDDLYKMVSEVINNNPSRLLRLLFYFKGRALVDKMGPHILKQMQSMSPQKLLTGQLKSLLTNVLAPDGGKWSGYGADEVYTGKPAGPYRTIDEKAAFDQKQQEEINKLHLAAKQTRDSLGDDIGGLVQIIAEPLHLQPRLIPSHSPSGIENMMISIEKGFLKFANSCIDKLITLSAYLLGMGTIVEKAGKSAYYQTRAIQQDSFLMAITLFAQEQLRPGVPNPQAPQDQDTPPHSTNTTPPTTL